MSVRAYLNTNLTPLLPTSWVVFDYDRTLSQIAKVTALYVHKDIEPGGEQGALLHNVSLVVVDPTQTEAVFDDRLDDLMEDLIPIIDQLPEVVFQRASKGTRDNYPCWDIQLQVKTTA